MRTLTDICTELRAGPDEFAAPALDVVAMAADDAAPADTKEQVKADGRLAELADTLDAIGETIRTARAAFSVALELVRAEPLNLDTMLSAAADFIAATRAVVQD